ncbi:MAG: HYR domain-containing protein, partial [Thermoleophilaceae bacterium]
ELRRESARGRCAARNLRDGMRIAAVTALLVVALAGTASANLVTSDVTQEALGNNPAVVNYDPPTQSTLWPVPVTSTCSPQPGSSFNVGTTAVDCVSVPLDTGSFNVNVIAGTGPTLAQPSNVLAYAGAGKTSAVVTYPLPAATDPSGVSSLACAPASGSAFALGNTLVRCDAKDGVGNPSAVVFYVTVANHAASGDSGGGTGASGARAAVLTGGATYVVKSGRTRVTVACPPGNPSACTGVTAFLVRLSNGKSATGTGQLVNLGSAKFSLAPGRSTGLTVKITRTGQRLLKRLKRFSALQQASTRDPAGRELASSRVVTLKQAKAKKKRSRHR